MPLRLSGLGCLLCPSLHQTDMLGRDSAVALLTRFAIIYFTRAAATKSVRVQVAAPRHILQIEIKFRHQVQVPGLLPNWVWGFLVVG